MPPICSSCNFPAGPRCGEIRAYRVNGTGTLLCDDCIHAAQRDFPEMTMPENNCQCDWAPRDYCETHHGVVEG